MYAVKELQDMLGIQFSDEDAVDALRQHEMACYVAANLDIISRAVREAKNVTQFYGTLRNYTMAATEKFPVSMEISQKMQSVLCDMVYAYNKGVQEEVAEAMRRGEDYYTVLFG